MTRSLRTQLFAIGGALCVCASLGSCGKPSEKAAASPPNASPRIDHILLEVKNMDASVAFYRDLLGLRVKSEKPDFTMLEGANTNIFLSSGRWDWDEARPTDARPGWGMYPHFDVADAAAVIERARQAGYKIPQEPRKYDWGTEAFVADPDGYVWALVSPPQK
ncbi:MAG: VOC family protein [Chthoniobacterales bacterium]